MNSLLNSPNFFWRSCGEPSAAWFLVCLPLGLLALEGSSSLGSAMARFLAVLLVAGLIWARGLGPSGGWAERIFIGAWAAAWAAALGLMITSGEWPASLPGLTALSAALLVGAGWLGWACQARQELRKALARGPRSDAPERSFATAWTIATAWFLAALLFALALSSQTAHWSDGVALVFALGSFTLFQRGGLGQPVSASD